MFCIGGKKALGLQTDGCVCGCGDVSYEDVVFAKRKIVVFGKSANFEKQVFFECNVPAVSAIWMPRKCKSHVVHCRRKVVILQEKFEKPFLFGVGAKTEYHFFFFGEVTSQVFQPFKARGYAIGSGKHYMVIFCRLYAERNGELPASELVYVLDNIDNFEAGVQFGESFEYILALIG